MYKKIIVLTTLLSITVTFSGCTHTSSPIESSNANVGYQSEEARAPVQVSKGTGGYDIQLSYNIIPNEADTSNTEISDVTMSVAVNGDIISECPLVNPALGGGLGNPYFPSDLSILLDLLNFSDWSIAVVKIPVKINTEARYYTSFFYCTDSTVQAVFPDDKQDGFFPKLSAQTVFETDTEANSFSFSDIDGEKYRFTIAHGNSIITLKAI